MPPKLLARIVPIVGGSAGDHVVGLPDDVRRMDLYVEYPPERTFQIVDADMELAVIDALSFPAAMPRPS